MDKGAIERLIEVVEAGGDYDDLYNPLGEVHVRYTALIIDAYNGSLDAAKALHEAVLPEVRFTIYGSAAMLEDAEGAHVSEAVCKRNPSRAWLLAILRALQSEAE